MTEKKKGGFKLSYLFFILLAVLLIVIMFSSGNTTGKKIDQSDFTALATGTYVDENKKTQVAEEIFYEDGVIYVLVKNSKYKDSFPDNCDYYFYASANYYNDLVARIEDEKADPTSTWVNIKYDQASLNTSWFVEYLPTILILVFTAIMFFVMFKMIAGSNKGAMSFGKTRAKAYMSNKVKFKDIAGADEEKAELEEIVEFLKNPAKFTNLGARIPKGILLVGNPGTGKTLLARAVAGESNVPFISISGSDFVEMFVGVGASRVRDLFEQAKKNKPCIVFIDEIDAVGRQRGAGLGGGNDEREQTLNQLLVEMDGFEANEGIIVLAATNRSDVLDPALMRPGRFDRQIYVNVPDVKGREGILRIHSKNKPLDENIDFKTLARITTGFTGADIENMLNEAAILAARAGRPKIIMTDITEGINKVIMGPQKKSRLVTDRDRQITAYHEAGHAVLATKLKHCEDVQEVSIIPRGMAGGYTMSRPSNDDQFLSYNKIVDDMAMAMGGRVAEELIFGEITTGASSDISHASKLAHNMVYEWGMSKKIGFLSLGADNQLFIGRDYQTRNNYSEKLAAEADDEVKSIIAENYKRAKDVLSKNIDLLKEMAKLLLEKETIYKDEVDLLLEGKKTEEIVAIMEEREKKQRKKEEKIKREHERNQKLELYKKKIAEGEKYLEKGIITKEELDAVKKEFKKYEKEVKEQIRLEEEAEAEDKTLEIKIEQDPNGTKENSDD